MKHVELATPAKGHYIECTSRNWVFEELQLQQLRMRREGDRCEHDIPDLSNMNMICQECFGTGIVGGYDALERLVDATEVDIGSSPFLLPEMKDEWAQMEFFCGFHFHIAPDDMFVFGAYDSEGKLALEGEVSILWKVMEVETVKEGELHLPTCWRIQCREVQGYEPARSYSGKLKG